MSDKWVEIARSSSVENTQACAAALAGVLDAGAVVTAWTAIWARGKRTLPRGWRLP